jgi:hypothetical protein
VTIEAEAIVPREISKAESVFNFLLLGFFFTILFPEPAARSIIFPTDKRGDFRCDEDPQDSGRPALLPAESGRGEDCPGIWRVSAIVGDDEWIDGDRMLRPSKIVASLVRREAWGSISGWRKWGDWRTETSSLVRTVSAVLEATEKGEEIALRKDAVVELGVGVAGNASRNSFRTCSRWIAGLSTIGIGGGIRGDFCDAGEGVLFFDEPDFSAVWFVSGLRCFDKSRGVGLFVVLNCGRTFALTLALRTTRGAAGPGWTVCGIRVGGLVAAGSLALLEIVFVWIIIPAGRGFVVERGRGVTVFGGVIREVVRGVVADSLTVGLGVVDLDDAGVKEAEPEATDFGGVETVLFAVKLLFEFMFQGGRGGGVLFPFKAVVCGGFNGVTAFAGVLTVVLRASAPFGGGGGGRLGGGIVADRVALNWPGVTDVVDLVAGDFFALLDNWLLISRLTAGVVVFTREPFVELVEFLGSSGGGGLLFTRFPRDITRFDTAVLRTLGVLAVSDMTFSHLHVISMAWLEYLLGRRECLGKSFCFLFLVPISVVQRLRRSG